MDGQIELVRVEKHRAGWKPQRVMRSAMRTGILPHHGGGHDPNKVIRLTITIKGPTHDSVSDYNASLFVKSVAQQNHFFSTLASRRNTYKSHREPNTWEAIWDLT